MSQRQRTESEKRLMHFASRLVYAKLSVAMFVTAIFLSGAWLIIRSRNEVWQAERSKAVVAVDLFLASKPNGLELAQKGVLENKRLAVAEYLAKPYLGEPDHDRRLTLLGSVLGINLESERVVKAIDESEIEAQSVWRNAFADAHIRDRVLQLASSGLRFSARVHWLLLANDDFRTLDLIEQSGEPSAIVLCHQIAACALEERDSAISWNSANLERKISERPMDSELHALAILLLGVVSQADPVDLKRIERQAVASQATVAMPAQWFLEKSKNRAIEFAPAQPSLSDWRIENPFPGVSITMIRLPAGEMVFTPFVQKGKENDPFAIIVDDEDLWVSNEKISFEIANEFAKTQTTPLGFEIGNKNGNANFSNANALFRFCNWLSEVSGYEPVYQFQDSATNETTFKPDEINETNIKRQTDGFRIPTRDEFFYIATCGEQSAVIESLYTNAKMFHSVRTRSMKQAVARASFLSIPSPWGIKNIFSLPAELFFNEKLGKLSTIILGEEARENFTTIPVADVYLHQLGVRLIRHSQRSPSTNPR